MPFVFDASAIGATTKDDPVMTILAIPGGQPAPQRPSYIFPTTINLKVDPAVTPVVTINGVAVDLSKYPLETTPAPAAATAPAASTTTTSGTTTGTTTTTSSTTTTTTPTA